MYSRGLVCGLNFETHSSIVCADVSSNRTVIRNVKRILHSLGNKSWTSGERERRRLDLVCT
ncbi:hypothetical protein GQ607_000420 [Colletotrichum asianum]|uniref:Uncharacterized protein n=1 Tax=Colletotrichum asianum TaxID=702518 RepID=A0A8H3WSL7_9PEZI|nr:hypothetical protein GQ607_000420 [Colletotrichum asianum]